MRVIICGSVEWTDGEMIKDEILKIIGQFVTSDQRLTVVHGAARGADRIADELARGMGLLVEPHPAEWTTFGKSAGVIRNNAMAALGADRVLAFKDGFNWKLDSGGTENMVAQANAVGIPVDVFTHDETPPDLFTGLEP